MLGFKDIRVPDDMEFRDISGEEIRTYFFEKTNDVIIERPIALCVSSSGGHKIITAGGESVYIPVGWIGFAFKVESDRDHWRF